jgi:hypothetical protein
MMLTITLQILNLFKSQLVYKKEKSLHNPLNYTWWTTLPPQTIESDFLLLELSKTDQITLSSGFGQWFCYNNGGFVCFFIFAESLKNYSKS